MKIINLDELELKCIEFGIRNKMFTKDDLRGKNLFSITLNSRYMSKTCDIEIINLYGENIELKFYSEVWESIYAQLIHFFREYWNYIEDYTKMPLYMKLSEAISKCSKDGYVKQGDVFNELVKELA